MSPISFTPSTKILPISSSLKNLKISSDTADLSVQTYPGVSQHPLRKSAIFLTLNSFLIGVCSLSTRALSCALIPGKINRRGNSQNISFHKQFINLTHIIILKTFMPVPLKTLNYSLAHGLNIISTNRNHFNIIIFRCSP